MSIYSIIESLRATSSRNSKEAILAKHRDDEELSDFFYLALNPFVNFYQKKIPPYTPAKHNQSDTLSSVMSSLAVLYTRQVTGNDAIAFLTKLFSSLRAEDAKALELIIQKDPDCGVSEATVNKIWPGLIRTFPVMLCSAFDQKLVDRLHWQKGVYVQLKSDGMRCNIVVNNGTVEVFSRNGRPIETHGVFDYLANFNKNFVIDGELLIRDNTGKFLDRKTGNGICNKALKGTGTKEQAETFYLNAWDYIPYEDFESRLCTDAYKSRFTYLQGVVGDIHYFTENINIGVIESTVVHSLSEAQSIFEEYLVKGEEGAILKDKTAIWEDKRSKQLVKLKAELDTDLKIVDVKLGTGKYEGQIGALICTDADGTLNVNVGSGLSDEQRSTLKTEELIGKIVTVTYNAKIQAKDGTWSLFLPRLVEIREDKDNANAFKEIK